MTAPAQQIMAAMEIDHEDEPNLTQFLDTMTTTLRTDR